MASLAELAYNQYVVRSDGAKFKNGARDDQLDTSWLAVTESSVRLGPGMYDELAVIAAAVTDSEIESWARQPGPFFDPASVVDAGGALSLLLLSPNGTPYRITVTDDGQLTTSPL